MVYVKVTLFLHPYIIWVLYSLFKGKAQCWSLSAFLGLFVF